LESSIGSCHIGVNGNYKESCKSSLILQKSSNIRWSNSRKWEIYLGITWWNRMIFIIDKQLLKFKMGFPISINHVYWIPRLLLKMDVVDIGWQLNVFLDLLQEAS
jgi:hypothetical protein